MFIGSSEEEPMGGDLRGARMKSICANANARISRQQPKLAPIAETQGLKRV